MKGFKAVRFVFLLVSLALGVSVATAQNFSIILSNSPGPFYVSNTVTYTIFVTNHATSGADVQVSNLFSAPVQLMGSSNSFNTNGTATSVNGALVFDLSTSFNTGSNAVLVLQIAPTKSGSLTNVANLGAVGIINNLAYATNVISVSNQPPPAPAVVAVVTRFPNVAVLAGDYFTYRVTVTNLGATTATNVALTNFIPPGVSVISITPTNPAASGTTNLVFSIGNMPAKAATNFTLTVEFTNSVTGPFITNTTVTNVLQTNGTGTNITTNMVSVTNFMVTSGTVTNFFIASAAANRGTASAVTNMVVVYPFDLTESIVASNASAMTYNPQTGLMEQTVNVSNQGTNTNGAARVVVSGLVDVLYNAIGTNRGNPFVQYGAPLPPGSNVNLVLEYFVAARQPINVGNSNYAAVPAPTPDLTPPAGTGTPSTLQLMLPSQNLMIEFPSTRGQSYTVVYADNASLSNAVEAQPPIVAPADRMQWIDHGPPKTLLAPTNTTSRFYKIVPTPP